MQSTYFTLNEIDSFDDETVDDYLKINGFAVRPDPFLNRLALIEYISDNFDLDVNDRKYMLHSEFSNLFTMSDDTLLDTLSSNKIRMTKSTATRLENN